MSKPVDGNDTHRVYDVAIKSPLEPAAKLSRALHNNIFLKREDLQSVKSFKLRGAYNKISQLSDSEKRRGILAASAGNHAQGVALSARRLGISALIVMPKTTPRIKIDAVAGYGAEVVLHGDNYSEAYEYCQQLMRETGRVFIHPFDDPLVIAGQGTVGKEILEQLPETTHIFMAVGGGGLAAGIGQHVKQLRPDIKIIGVEPSDSNAMALSLEQGKRVILPHVGVFADGVAVKQVGELTFELTKQYVDEVIVVSIDETCAAIKAIFEETRTIMEPAGALGVAGAIAYCRREGIGNHNNLVAVCSGANMTFEKLRFIAERTLTGSGVESFFAVTLPETPGALHKFCNEIINDYSITEFNYRLNKRDKAHIFLGLLIDQESKLRLVNKMKDKGYLYTDLSEDDLTKDHVKRMIGGAGQTTHDEHLYQVTFPERPRALNDFLTSLGDKWNISLFNYRGIGGDVGKVFIGFEASDVKHLEAKLRDSGFEFEKAISPAVKLFLQ